MLDNLPRGTICIEDIEMGMSRYLQKVVTDRDIDERQHGKLGPLLVLACRGGIFDAPSQFAQLAITS